jgi:carboxyl-terminal processing protease
MTSTRRLFSLVALILAVGVAAVLVGARAGVGGAAPPKMGTYMELLALIEDRRIPDTDPKKIVYASIQGMLQTLDPHTNFLDDEVYREMREEQKGSFYGLGIVISKRGRYQPLKVIAPMAETPAARMGIRVGDVITHIRDVRAAVDTETLGLTIQEAVKYLRGPQGTEVEVTIDRPGLEAPLIFRITRDAVHTPAVSQVFLPRPGIGYVHIVNFTENSSAELDKALEQLRAGGAKRLILDLQGNPGGLLEQAISVSSRFLAPGELVVYTEARQPNSRQDYAALRDAPHLDWPIVVTIDRGSASASEIVAGALQDHDRALIVGETSFGKGLVQSVYPLSENCGLALTTQKYFSPAGRSIQRPYTSEEEYYLENFQREAAPKPPPNAPVAKTDLGRRVYGGGGITPDVAVSTPEPSDAVVELARVSAFSRFVSPLPDQQRARYEQNPDRLFEDFLAFAAKEAAGLEQDKIRAAKKGGR